MMNCLLPQFLKLLKSYAFFYIFQVCTTFLEYSAGGVSHTFLMINKIMDAQGFDNLDNFMFQGKKGTPVMEYTVSGLLTL